MVYNGILQGKFSNLRSVTENDAAFILEMRNNPEISKRIPPLRISVEQQRTWITNQRADSDSYYFIIEDKKHCNIGTVSVYNIVDGHAEVGRFCSLGDAVKNSEAALLINDFNFYTLKLEYLDIWVYKDNKPVISLNKGFGCEWDGEETGKDGISYLYGIMTKQNYELKAKKIRDNLLKLRTNGN